MCPRYKSEPSPDRRADITGTSRPSAGAFRYKGGGCRISGIIARFCGKASHFCGQHSHFCGKHSHNYADAFRFRPSGLSAPCGAGVRLLRHKVKSIMIRTFRKYLLICSLALLAGCSADLAGDDADLPPVIPACGSRSVP